MNLPLKYSTLLINIVLLMMVVLLKASACRCTYYVLHGKGSKIKASARATHVISQA